MKIVERPSFAVDSAVSL